MTDEPCDELDDVGAGHPGDRSILADLLDKRGQRRDGVIEAEIVISEQEDEIPRSHPEDFGKIGERIARFGKDDLAILAPKPAKQVALLGVARIVTHNDFDIGARPGASLRNS